MSAPNPAVVDTARAAKARQHDVSDRMGQAVGIDPVSGRIWFGRKALDIARQMRRRHRSAVLLRARGIGRLRPQGSSPMASFL